MTRQRVTRLANPRRKRKTSANRNRAGQFVKRRKVAKTRAKVNPVRRKKAATRRRTRRTNPVLITLGAINPRPRRKNKVARRRRKASATVRRRRRRANPVAVAPRRRRRARVVRRRRRSNPVVHVRRRRRVARRNPRRRHYRRNPSVFGRSVASVGGMEAILGGLIGVTAAKILPTYIPASMLNSPILRVLATGASAWVASLAIGKLRPGMSDAVMFGGLMQTASVGLNLFIPSIGGQIGLSGYGRGMGDLVDGHFVVPQNPLKYMPPPAPAQARANMNGLTRAFGTAF